MCRLRVFSSQLNRGRVNHPPRRSIDPLDRWGRARQKPAFLFGAGALD
jgi:hypothetical protein